MSGASDFVAEARRTYTEANARSLGWMLARLRPGVPFLDTKLNPLTLAAYGPADGWRGPGYIYGWIQGRGLEAIALHAAFFEREDPALARALDGAGTALRAALIDLCGRTGHASFVHDAATLRPIRPGAGGAPVPQTQPADLFTYTDIFVRKGLVAAAARWAPDELPRSLAALAELVPAIEEGRFVMDERGPIDTAAAAAQPADFGPRMILLSAAGLLARMGRPEAAAFAGRFVDHVLARHFDPHTGLLRDVPGEDRCNVGHAIELVGFALDWLPPDADPALIRTLERVLSASFEAGFTGPGIRLMVSARTGRPTSPYCPWWSLPESIRASALAWERTGSDAALGIWRRAHEAFFGSYWRSDPPIAYQTLTADGPVDHVPATPDLDPGYHTGLSLLAAIEVADRRGAHRPTATERTG